MFSKAIRDHTNTTKPLQPNQARLNAAQPIATNQAAGAKRKFEMARPQQTPLATLHSAVYFDENDFEDDEDIDLEGSIGVPAPLEDLKPMPTTTKPEIKYPALPPVPDISRATPQEPGPSSSVPLPWSSSPPTHFAPPQPPKRRTLPWEGKETKPETKPETKLTRTPSNKKQTLPWNTSMSALKESQKELRKQQKTRIAQEKKDIQVGQIAPKVPSIFLSEEQKRVVEAIVNDGKSIFFTGSAGTGKSVLMREIIRRLREKYKREPDRVAVTASTGLAACNIEGVTLHSFAGVGLGKEGVADLVKKVKRNQKAKTRWMRTKILIIDEVSMVDGEFFDKLEELARKIRSNGRPFGGIQLVVTGDFFQLPPVPDSSREAKFAFAAATWNTSIQHTILLTHVFRQKDPAFAAMLNEMRLGNLSPPTINAFKALARPLNFDDSLEATELFPTRTEVENANSVRMNRLSGENMTFTAIDSGTIQDVQQRERLLANCMAPPVIHLKKGAQVMLIKNMDETLVNGSLGKVIAFMDEIRFDFHTKSDDNLQDGSGYLSDDDPSVRARKKLKGMSYDPNGGGVNTGRKWPVVCFTLPDGTERHLLCQPEAWKIELPNGEVQAQRQQVPLILAWALSIHKAQGQTLQRVKVDLGRVFEKGQAYVALSRATSQEGLQVSRFDPKKVMVHPKVIDFYANLSTIQDVRRSDAVVDIRAPKGGRSDAKYQQDDDDYEAAILQSLA